VFSNRRTNNQLAAVGYYSITIERKDDVTFSIRISDVRDNTTLVDFPLDPMDKTLAGTLTSDAVKKLGRNAPAVLETLSITLQEHVGAKEFIMLPAGSLLPDFVPVQDHAFKRMRQANRENIIQHTDAILSQYSDLAAMLDQQYDFVVGVDNIRNLVYKFEQRAFDLLNGHANFTQEKMKEYKDEDIQGTKSRLDNSYVTVIAMLDKQNKLCGMLRSLAMGDEVAYLSDETINQEIIPLEKFSGETEQEKAQNRGVFLLAYFANRAVSQIDLKNEFVIIAAAGRENFYKAIGFDSFPMTNHVLTMKFDNKPRPLMTDLQKLLMTPPSKIAAVKQFGVVQSSGVEAAEVKQEDKKAHFNWC
jgi:hypothetical protein